MRRTGKGYIRVIEFVFINERQIREAISNTPDKRIEVDGEMLENPAVWLKVVDATYKWCNHDELIVARDRYNGVDYRVTCAKLNVSNTTRRRLLHRVLYYACLCAVQFGLLKVC